MAYETVLRYILDEFPEVKEKYKEQKKKLKKRF